MKKTIIALSVLFMVAGCDSTTESLSCKSSRTTNGIISETTYKIDYDDNDVKYITITYDHNRYNNTPDNKDGVNADTDGLSEENNNNNTINSDDVIDGVVGDAIDETIKGVTETILDIAGIKNNLQNQLSVYDNIEGFSYDVDTDTNNQYKITYKIDMNKINDQDLSAFNVTRNLSDMRKNIEALGYSCK